MIYPGAVRETVSILGVSNSNGFNTASQRLSLFWESCRRSGGQDLFQEICKCRDRKGATATALSCLQNQREDSQNTQKLQAKSHLLLLCFCPELLPVNNGFSLSSLTRSMQCLSLGETKWNMFSQGKRRAPRKADVIWSIHTGQQAGSLITPSLYTQVILSANFATLHSVPIRGRM